MTNQTTIYLDNAATSFPKPECVYVAVDEYMRNCGSAFGRGNHGGTGDAGQIVNQCRNRLANLINAQTANSVAFTFNATDGLNLLLRGLLRAGDRVVTTRLEHNSVLRPLEQLRHEIKIEVDHISFDADSGLIDSNQLKTSLDQSPCRLVVVNHASNVTGSVQPLTEIIQTAHEADALVLVDAAQTAGHIPVDVQQMDIDLLAAAGHKGLLGPLGTGFVYVKDQIQNELRSVRCGGTGTISDSIVQPDEMPVKLESGNLNMPGIAGLNAALGWIESHPISQVQSDIRRHLAKLASELSAIAGVNVLCPQQFESDSLIENAGAISLSLDGIDCREAALMLENSFSIRCRAGLHCAPLVHQTLNTLDSGGTLRFSPGPFTTDAEIDRTIEAVASLSAAFAV